ncbi:MAG: putative pirin-like protein [Ilumatobacteraceae bacterium]|nr:putative pirin-like protein [Ilumatobacteraceae bacterium]
MPAITADTLQLTKLTVPGPTSRDRSVVSVTSAPSGFEGEGFPVKRAFAGVDQRLLDPFIHMDEMGAVEYAPYEPKGTDWHPHRGFETVTYMIDGTFQHQDSHGGGGVIENGATQWMTAGAGILHIETPPESLVVSGGLFHGVQLWVNLPAKDKMISPAYQNLEGDQVTLLASPDGGALVRLIAGEIDGHAGPGSTHTPIAVAHVTVSPGARLSTPWNPAFNSLAYVLDGSGTVGVEQRPVQAGQLVVFGEGDTLTITNTTSGATAKPMEVLLLGGQPIREPIATYGPFVMNHRHEIQQAVEDFNAGKLGTIPANGLHPYRGSHS